MTRWPHIQIERRAGGMVEATVVGILGFTLASDTYDAFDVDAIRASAVWLGVPRARLYDLTIAARGGAA